MSSNDEELTTEQLEAFDLLINHLQEKGDESVNLKQFLLTGGDSRWAAARAANAGRRRIANATRDVLMVVAKAEKINSNDLSQLDRDVSLERLLEIRRELG